MSSPVGKQQEIRPSDRAEARATAMLLIAGAALVVLSLALPHPAGGHSVDLAVTAAGMVLVGAICWACASRVPVALVHVLIAGTVLVTGVLILESEVAAGQFGSIFVWATLITAYFFPRRVAIAHLVWLLAVFAGALALVPSTAGYSPITRFVFTAVTLGVVAFFINNLVSRRERADVRAGHFFDLSQDMLCTMDRQGRCVEVNAAWRRNLGYRPEELEGTSLLSLTHPDDHARATEEAMKVFGGGISESFDTRVRAKDGSLHWMRTSSVFEPDEGLIYARSTDVTERKAIQAEREALLDEIQSLASSDALTGLPNRRALDDRLPGEMARALRAESSLCLAIVDIDNFKAYNDTHGHLAGDGVLRDCAAAWDGALRGEDTILRFGGEEFLVILPNCEPADAAEIVERLRAATPDGQTCSAGLAQWRPGESIDDLVGRADAALYRAKDEGRDRLVSAAA